MTQILGGSGPNGISQNYLSSVYKTIASSMKNLSDVSYSPGSSTTYQMSNFTLLARNLTIGPNATLNPTGQGLSLICCDTLTLNGTIDVSGANGGNGSGSLAYTGGVGNGLLLFARQIANGSTGTIKSNGGAGGNGGTTSGGTITSATGTAGTFLGSGSAAAGGGAGQPNTAGGAGGNGGNGGGGVGLQLATFPLWIATLLGAYYGQTTAYDIASQLVYGGQGASCGTNGTSSNSYSLGGNGGGGAGCIWLFTESVVPAINLQANGGNGGNGGGGSYNITLGGMSGGAGGGGSAVAAGGAGGGNNTSVPTTTQAAGGGGGGGGYIGIYAPSSSATTSVNGGTGGTGFGGNAAGTGVNGGNGIANTFNFQP